MIDPNKLLMRMRREKMQWLKQWKEGDIVGERTEVKGLVRGLDLAIAITRGYQLEVRQARMRQ